MISTLTLQDFQSHKNTTLDFHPGVNVIIGSTDSGKTAIIRALREIIWNRPGGLDYISHWAKSMAVQIEIDNTIIRKEKSHTRNAYVINGKEYVAFGRDVPDDLRQLLRMDEINLQAQMDGPFLLSQSPGEIALHFNRIAKIDNIHTTINNIKQKSKKLEQTQQFKLQEISTLTEKITKLSFLEKMEVDVEVLEELESRKIQIQTRYDKLTTLLKIHTKIDTELKQLLPILELEKKVDIILAASIKKKELEERKRELLRALKCLDDIIYQIDIKTAVERLEMPVDSILELYSNRTKIQTQKNAFETLIDKLKRNQTQIVQKTGVLQEIEKEFRDNFPTMCPLCNSVVNEKNHKH